MIAKFASIVLPLAALACLPTAAAAAAAIDLRFGNGVFEVVQLPVGDDLYVGFSGAAPGADYEIRVLLPSGEPVGGRRVRADDAGKAEKLNVWQASGVGGCDCEMDDRRIVFERFKEAEEALAGKNLRIEVVDAGGELVAAAPLRVMMAGSEMAYFSDADGCARRYFKLGEKVYLSFHHADPSRRERYLYLAASQPWPLGQPLEDVRGAAERISLPEDAESFTVPLELGDLGLGAFDGVLRRADREPFFNATDYRLKSLGGEEIAPGSVGLNFTFDGCGPRPR